MTGWVNSSGEILVNGPIIDQNEILRGTEVAALSLGITAEFFERADDVPAAK